MTRHQATGISPKLLKVIDRVVYICERCGLREQHDTVIRDFDIKDGVNLWGSGGVCMGCKKNETCESSPSRIMMGNNPAHLVLGGFCYGHCPIHSFEIREEYVNQLQESGEILID